MPAGDGVVQGAVVARHCDGRLLAQLAQQRTNASASNVWRRALEGPQRRPMPLFVRREMRVEVGVRVVEPVHAGRRPPWPGRRPRSGSARERSEDGLARGPAAGKPATTRRRPPPAMAREGLAHGQVEAPEFGRRDGRLHPCPATSSCRAPGTGRATAGASSVLPCSRQARCRRRGTRQSPGRRTSRAACSASVAGGGTPAATRAQQFARCRRRSAMGLQPRMRSSRLAPGRAP